jgi:protein N-terminal methyltransferase
MDPSKAAPREPRMPTEEIGSSIQTNDTLISSLPNKDAGLKYWNSVESNVDSMLGGLPTLEGFSVMSKVDLQSSRNFLAKLGIGVKRGLRLAHSVLEGGAG